MNNHSIIWKNITMIIFFILMLLILFVKFKLHILLKLNGTKSYIEIRLWKFVFSRKGSFFLKKNSEKEKKESFNKKEQRSIMLEKETKDNMIKKLYNKNKIIFFVLKKFKIEKLYIYEEIGLLTPIATAMAIPVISTTTVTLIRKLEINFENFKYKIIPIYKDLKFNFLCDADISFRIIPLIISIIKDKIAQIKLKMRR